MNTVHIALALILVVLLFALTDPFMYWMPEAGAMLALVIAAALALVFAGFVMQENGGDERDVAHRSFAGRVAYLLGLGALTIALLVQGFSHALDPWIPLTLGLMIVSKIAARVYADRYR